MTVFPINPLIVPVTSKPVIEFLNQGSTSNNATTYTFTGRSLGVESADRYIILSSHSTIYAAGTPISATIAGVSASLLFSDQGLGLFIAPVPTGTTGTITITFASLADRCFFGMWSLKGAWGKGSAIISSASGTSATASVNTLYANDGVTLAAATFGSTSTSPTWSGISTPDYYNFNGSATRGMGAHDASNLSGPSSKTISATCSSTNWKIVSAAFR